MSKSDEELALKWNDAGDRWIAYAIEGDAGGHTLSSKDTQWRRANDRHCF
jgi:hypothetical protein